MNSTKLVAIVLIVLGAMGLAYGGFTYTKDTHHTDIGPLHMTVNEKEHVNVPVWAGVGVLVVGLLMLGVPRKN